MSHREKAKGLVELACDEDNSKEERMSAAIKAVAIIKKYKLLDNPLDSAFDSLKEDPTFKASKKVVETLTDPDLVSSVQTIGQALGRLGGKAREASSRRRR